jgi:hypothetical protein
MKIMRTAVVGALAVLLCGVAANATVDPYKYTYETDDLNSLDHRRIYAWGMEPQWDTDLEVVVFVKVSFKNLRNYNDEENDLYVNLLDTTLHLGVHSMPEFSPMPANWFEILGPASVLVEHYEDLPDYGQDRSFELTSAELIKFNEFASDGRFGLGLDPDCHFYSCGTEVEVHTALIPEPATLGLLGIGALGQALRFRRRRRRR